MRCGLWIRPVRSLSGWRPHEVLAQEALEAGAQCIVFEEKNFEEEEFIEEALKVKALCDEHKVPLVIMDHPAAAFIVGVDRIVRIAREADAQAALAAGAAALVLLQPLIKTVREKHPAAFLVAEEEADKGIAAVLKEGADAVLVRGPVVKGAKVA